MADRKEYNFDTRDQAEYLYVCQGMTYEEVSRETGVSTNQLKRWGATGAGDWRKKRGEWLRNSVCQIAKLAKIRDDILTKLEQEIQPNLAHQLMSAWKQADRAVRTAHSRYVPLGGGREKSPLMEDVILALARILLREALRLSKSREVEEVLTTVESIEVNSGWDIEAARDALRRLTRIIKEREEQDGDQDV